MRQLAVAVLLLATLLGLTQTFALQTSTVKQASSMPVVSTNSALIAVSPTDPIGPATGTPTGMAYYADATTGNVLVLDFRKGRGGSAVYGPTTPPSSSYPNVFYFKKLFYVTNNSATTKCITVYVPSGGPADLAEIWVGSQKTGGAAGVVQKTSQGTNVCYSLSPAASVQVDFKWVVSSTAEVVDKGFQVRVEGN